MEDDNNVHGKLNLACRRNGVEQRRKLYLNYLYYLNKGAGLLPTYVGRAYRGIRDRLPESYYRVGSKITWNQISSSSKSALVTINFLGKTNDGDLQGSLFILDIDSGYEIQFFSEIPHEEEVLLQLNSIFSVKKKIVAQKKCEELPTLLAYNLENVDIYILKQL